MGRIDELAAAIHESGKQTVLCITGGGTSSVGRLLTVPGGSRSVLEAVIPYSQAALRDWLGGAPDQACSESTARAMAMAAWMRARALAPETTPHSLIGVGATASLISRSPKHGAHRIHVGVQTARATNTFALQLVKGLRTRKQEENVARRLILAALGHGCELNQEQCSVLLHNTLKDEEHVIRRDQRAESAWMQLLLGERDWVLWPPKTETTGARPRAILPGAFHPIHQGHQRMAQVATEALGLEVAYELSVSNVDKPPLDYIEMDSRLSEIQNQDPDRSLLLTQAPTFVAKAALLPGSTFVVGIDTLVRIAEVRYYDGDPVRRDRALQHLSDLGCRFLVFGRAHGGRFQTLHDVSLPSVLVSLCQQVPESEFREDISSTALRRQSADRSRH